MQEKKTPLQSKVIAYIDGYNLLYAIKDKLKLTTTWEQSYHLDLFRFCNLIVENYCKNSKLVGVNLYMSQPNSKFFVRKFKQYIQYHHNEYGVAFHYANKKTMVSKMKCCHEGHLIEIKTEKQVDVQIAVDTMHDICSSVTDKVILISADTDFYPLIDNLISKDVDVIHCFPPTFSCNYKKDFYKKVAGNVFLTPVELNNHRKKYNNCIIPFSVIQNTEI